MMKKNVCLLFAILLMSFNTFGGQRDNIIIQATDLSLLPIINEYTTYSDGNWDGDKFKLNGGDYAKSWTVIDGKPYFFNKDGSMSIKEGASYKVYGDSNYRATIAGGKLIMRDINVSAYINYKINE
ncbi:MAG: hypothetical protein IJT67_03015 [Lachnospiraceae bacterium]|nr:hypothetical protein [Lachnospiraceae bacterium]